MTKHTPGIMTLHTPGPWTVGKMNKTRIHATQAGYLIGQALPSEPNSAPQEQCEANARLIAAAPDLLEAAKVVVEAYMRLVQINGLPSLDLEHSMKILKGAIAKA